jgi:Family of unknown function (DUF5318)
VPSEIDYSLARRATLADVRRGRVPRTDVCDAHPELVRAATHHGKPTGKSCPVCDEAELVLVHYVYGDRLRHVNGRVISEPKEIAKLRKTQDEFTLYTVEVCTECRWNYLVRRALQGKAHRR